MSKYKVEWVRKGIIHAAYYKSLHYAKKKVKKVKGIIRLAEEYAYTTIGDYMENEDRRSRND
jgi:hypothetical protein